MTQAQRIRIALDEHQPVPGALPVVFNGRIIGTAYSIAHVDALLIEQRLSAQHISRAQLTGDARQFFIAHA